MYIYIYIYIYTHRDLEPKRVPPLTARWHGEVTHGHTVISPSSIFPLARRSVAPSGYINTASKGRSQRGYGLGGRHLPPTASLASDIVARAFRPGQSAGGTFNTLAGSISFRWGMRTVIKLYRAHTVIGLIPCASTEGFSIRILTSVDVCLMGGGSPCKKAKYSIGASEYCF